MRVYCRFAPPCLPVMTGEERGEGDSQPSSWLPPPMVLLSLRETLVEQRRQQTLTVADPRSGGTVSATCRHVFLPSSMAAGASAVSFASTSTPSAVAAAAGQQQQAVFETIVQPFIDSLFSGKRAAFLAYGQTATGKTYTMFGPGADGDRIALGKHQEWQPDVAKDVQEEDGIVPRLLRAIFEIPIASMQPRKLGFLDMSCVEVYNESATDLVAFLLQQGAGKKAAPACRKKMGGNDTERDEDASDAARQAWLRYVRGQQRDESGTPLWGATSSSLSSSLMGVSISRGAAAAAVALKKVVYKATEKSKVLRSVQCLRCESAAESWSVLRDLLALRHRSQTERNVRSSRSHLLLRLVLYGGEGDALRLGEALIVDLAGSETYRDYAWAANNSMEMAAAVATPQPPTAPTAVAVSVTAAAQRERGGSEGIVDRDSLAVPSSQQERQQLLFATTPPVGSTFASSRRDGDGLTVTQRAALRTNEMRHINSSLLALRKVVRVLREAPSATRIPFRDSTLTTIIEPFLAPGNETSVVWVVCCSSRQRDFHETVESLRLGAEASAIPACVQLCPIVAPTNNLRNRSGGGGGDGSSSSSSSRGCSDSSSYLAVEGNAGGMEPPAARRISAPATCGDRGQRRAESGRGRNEVASGAVILRENKSRDTLAEERGGKEMEEEKDVGGVVEAYKQYAHHLLERCKSICERYDACVEELARTKQTLASRDSEIARLREALGIACDKQQQPQLQLQLDVPSPSFSAPTRGKNAITTPPLWLRQSAVRPTTIDAASLGCQHAAAAAAAAAAVSLEEHHSPSSSSRIREEEEDVMVAAHAKAVGNEKNEEAEAVRLVEAILQQHCIQHVPLRQLDGKPNGGNHSVLEHTAGMSGGSKTRNGQGCAADEARAHRRSDRLVSFVSPSSHGAIPLMQVEEELGWQHALPPPPPRSSLRVLSTPSHLELQLKPEEATRIGASDAKILQHLLSRSAAFVGAASKRSAA